MGQEKFSIQFTTRKGLHFNALQTRPEGVDQSVWVAKVSHSKTSLFINAISKTSDPGDDFYFSSQEDSVVYVARGELSVENGPKLEFFAKEYISPQGKHNQIIQVCHKSLFPEHNVYFVLDVVGRKSSRPKMTLQDLLKLIQSVEVVD